MIDSLLTNCYACELREHRKNVVPGSGNLFTEIVFVGEAPGATEDESGLPFQGKAGKILDKTLDFLELPRYQVYITNAVKCRPPGNVNPDSIMLNTCYEWLFAELCMIDPTYIVTLGSIPFKSLCGVGKFGDSVGKLTYPEDDRLKHKEPHVLPLYHPAYTFRGNSAKKLYIRAALELRKLLRGKIKITNNAKCVKVRR